MENKHETFGRRKHHSNPSPLSHIAIPDEYVGKYPSNGFFPSKPFYGMQIYYTITHTAIKKQDDFIGKEAERVLIGHIINSHIELDGYIKICSDQGCHGASIQISLTDIANPDNTITSYLNLSDSDTIEQPFHLFLELPPSIQEAHITIVILGDYESGTRSLKINGKLKVSRILPPPLPYPAFSDQRKDPSSFFPSGDTKLNENGILLWNSPSLTKGPGGFPTGSYQISEEGYILMEKISPDTVSGTYFGIPELYGSGHFMGRIMQNELTKEVVIEATWKGNPPYYCKNTFEPGKLRIAFSEDGNRFHMNYSQCGDSETVSNPPNIGYLVYPNFYPIDGMFWDYNEMPGQQVAKEGTMRTILNPISPGLLSNSILGFYDHNKGCLTGNIVGNILLGYFFYSFSDDRIYFGETFFLFDPISHSFIANWNPAGFL